MITQIKTTYVCEYCKKHFASDTQCVKHEKKCKQITSDTQSMNKHLRSVISHYEKKGYAVTFRYLDNELLLQLTYGQKKT